MNETTIERYPLDSNCWIRFEFQHSGRVLYSFDRSCVYQARMWVMVTMRMGAGSCGLDSVGSSAVRSCAPWQASEPRNSTRCMAATTMSHVTATRDCARVVPHALPIRFRAECRRTWSLATAGQSAARGKPAITFVAATITQDLCEPSNLRRRAQSCADVECLPLGHPSYSEKHISSCDSPARRCACVEAETLPARLRCWTPSLSVTRATIATTMYRCHELPAPAATPCIP